MCGSSVKKTLTVHGPRTHGDGLTPAHPQDGPTPIKPVKFAKGFFGISSFHERYKAAQAAGLVTPRGHVVSWTLGGVTPRPHDFHLPKELGLLRRTHGKAYRADWSYAGEEVTERLFCYMRREVCNKNVGSLVDRTT
jgi:hypothetical protein